MINKQFYRNTFTDYVLLYHSPNLYITYYNENHSARKKQTEGCCVMYCNKYFNDNNYKSAVKIYGNIIADVK